MFAAGWELTNVSSWMRVRQCLQLSESSPKFTAGWELTNVSRWVKVHQCLQLSESSPMFTAGWEFANVYSWVRVHQSLQLDESSPMFPGGSKFTNVSRSVRVHNKIVCSIYIWETTVNIEILVLFLFIVEYYRIAQFVAMVTHVLILFENMTNYRP